MPEITAFYSHKSNRLVIVDDKVQSAAAKPRAATGFITDTETDFANERRENHKAWQGFRAAIDRALGKNSEEYREATRLQGSDPFDAPPLSSRDVMLVLPNQKFQSMKVLVKNMRAAEFMTGYDNLTKAPSSGRNPDFEDLTVATHNLIKGTIIHVDLYQPEFNELLHDNIRNHPSSSARRLDPREYAPLFANAATDYIKREKSDAVQKTMIMAALLPKDLYMFIGRMLGELSPYWKYLSDRKNF